MIDEGTTVDTDGAETTTAAPAAAAPTGGKDGGTPAAPAATPAADAGKNGKTIAAGGETVAAPVPATWPADWKERMARGMLAEKLGVDYDKVPAGEIKKLLKETTVLGRTASPEALYGRYQQLTDRISSEVRVPGPKASDEEKAAFAKAIGVPETPEGYADKIKLANNRVLGDNDLPIFKFFAARLHPDGVTPKQMSTITDAFFDYQQSVADTQTEDDLNFHATSEKALKAEWGPSYPDITGAIGTMLDHNPGLFEIVNTARMPDGRLLGDHPVFLKWMGPLAEQLHPNNANHTGGGTASVDSRINEFKKKSEAGTITDAERTEWVGLIDAQMTRERRAGKRA